MKHSNVMCITLLAFNFISGESFMQNFIYQHTIRILINFHQLTLPKTQIDTLSLHFTFLLLTWHCIIIKLFVIKMWADIKIESLLTDNSLNQISHKCNKNNEISIRKCRI